MANRDNHYEAAFEQFLRDRSVPYIAVDEAKRSLVATGPSIKNLDFVVSSPGAATMSKGGVFQEASREGINTGKTGQRRTILIV